LALWTIPVATVTVVASVASVVSIESSTLSVSALVASVVSSSAVSIRATASFFTLFFWTNSYFRSDECIEVQFSVDVGHVSEWSVGISENSIDFADVNPGLSVDYY
jgi:hypothetical protein